MRVRLLGTRLEITAAVRALRAAAGLHVEGVSRLFPNHGCDQVRVYVTASIVEETR